eukprot:10916853-Alexandrium_andersonii.AAC.1
MAHAHTRVVSARRPRGRQGRKPRAAHGPRRRGAPERRQRAPARQGHPPDRRPPCWAARRPCPLRAVATPRPPLRTRPSCTVC